MFFRQFRDSGCLSYVIADEIAKEAAVIDPSLKVGQYLQLLGEKGFRLTHIIDTHTHADHVSGAGLLKEKTGAKIVMSSNTPLQRSLGGSAPAAIQSILQQNCAIPVDLQLRDGEALRLADLSIRGISAPGHNKDIVCLELPDRVLTGDSLMIGHVGRMDLPGSSAEEMYDSVHRLVSMLDDDMIVYPGHDYNGNVNSTIGYEKVNNEFVRIKTKEEFVRIAPTRFAPLSGAGMQCGTISCAAAPAAPQPSFKEQMMAIMAQAFRQNPQNLIRTKDLMQRMANGEKVPVVDVREEEELRQTGKIPGAVHIPLAQLSAVDVSKLPPRGSEVVVNCAGGGRAVLAALFLQNLGWKARSLDGGMPAWLREGNKAELSFR
jgi:glyoxylase-like metal-dependent hydrolase (beta-lactamase superfamily II)